MCTGDLCKVKWPEVTEDSDYRILSMVKKRRKKRISVQKYVALTVNLVNIMSNLFPNMYRLLQ